MFQVNLCTYYSKGLADYVGIWDFDEFFIPKGSNKNLLEVISNAYPEKTLDPEIPRVFNENISVDKTWPGGRGWADGNGHPACYLQIRLARTHFISAINRIEIKNNIKRIYVI